MTIAIALIVCNNSIMQAIEHRKQASYTQGI